MTNLHDLAIGALHLADVTLNPKPEALPGAGTLQHLANGLAGWALIGSLVAVVIGAGRGALRGQDEGCQQQRRNKAADHGRSFRCTPRLGPKANADHTPSGLAQLCANSWPC